MFVPEGGVNFTIQVEVDDSLWLNLFCHISSENQSRWMRFEKVKWHF